MEETIEYILNCFSFIGSVYPGVKTEVTKAPFMIEVYFFLGDIAIELEVDSRERRVFLLLVKLENGMLPDGYYVSKEGRCRRHFTEIIQEKDWLNLDNAMARLRSIEQSAVHRDLKYIEDCVNIYSELVRDSLPSLMQDHHDVF